MNPEYLIQHPVDLLVWHIEEIHQTPNETPVVRMKQDEKLSSTQVFIYANDQSGLFTRICSSLEQMQLNIVGANFAERDTGQVLVTLTFLDSKGKRVTALSDQQNILKAIKRTITRETFSVNDRNYRIPRQLKYFDIPTRMTFTQNKTRGQTVLTLYTSDCPGLLTRISEVFYNEGLVVRTARISTLGEEAEDIFYLTDNDNNPILDIERQESIRELLTEKLLQLWQ